MEKIINGNEIEKFTEELYKQNPEVSKEYIPRIKNDLIGQEKNIDLNSLYRQNELDNLSILKIYDSTEKTEKEAAVLRENLEQEAKNKMLEERKISKMDIAKKETIEDKKFTLSDLINQYYEKEIEVNPIDINERIKEEENKVLEYLSLK